MNPQEQNKKKRRAVTEFLDRGMVRLSVDSGQEGCMVPKHLLGNPRLALNLSHRFTYPVEMTDFGVSTTLSFSGADHPVFIPWPSVWACEGVGKNPGGVLFPDDMPAELRKLLPPEFLRQPQVVGVPEPEVLEDVNVCEHGDHLAPPGQLYCSPECERCDRGWDRVDSKDDCPGVCLQSTRPQALDGGGEVTPPRSGHLRVVH